MELAYITAKRLKRGAGAGGVMTGDSGTTRLGAPTTAVEPTTITPGAGLTEVRRGDANMMVAFGDLPKGDNRVGAEVAIGTKGFGNPKDRPKNGTTVGGAKK